MKFYFLVLVMLSSSCAIQTRYNLKKQKQAQTTFQNNKNTTFAPSPSATTQSSKTTTANKPAYNNTLIADMKNEIAQLAMKSEQLKEKIDSLELVVLDLRKKKLKKSSSKSSASNISKVAKQIITKKKKRQKLGNFAQAQKSFRKKQWELAIESYEKYRKLNPRGKNYALATYNIALSLEKLGFKEEAKSFYNEILDPSGRYAKSKIAKKVKAKQKKLSSKKAQKI